MKRIAAVIAVAGLALAPSVAFAADEPVDVAAWLKANKTQVEFFLDVDVDTCKGLEGLTYEQSVQLADLNGVDLKALAKKADADAMLKYVNESGVTIAEVRGFLEAFCMGEIPPPPVDATTPPPTASEKPPTASESPSPTAPGSESPKPSVVPSDDVPADDRDAPGGDAPEKDGSDAPGGDPALAETGSSSPVLPIGIGAALVGTGGALILLKRKGLI